MAELQRSGGLLHERIFRQADPSWATRPPIDFENEPVEPPLVNRRKPDTVATGQGRKATAAVLVGLLASFAIGWLLFPLTLEDSLTDFIGPRWKDESATHFSFAVAADLGEPDNPDSMALAARARASGASFLIALGDLGYPDEVGWCRDIRRYVPELAIVAGDHDGERLGTQLADFSLTCPYTLPSPFVLGNGSAALGFEYSFDYPHLSPLARFIMISPGLEGPVAYNYSEGSPHEEWVEDRVADARDRGIPWVIVGVHKQCITVNRRCSMGGIFEELVEDEVDLIVVGNHNVYARSKQLYESDACDAFNWTDEFVPDCVVSQTVSDAYPKGKGTVVVVQGVGGHEFDNVTLDGSDPKIGYFDEVMGGNANTESRLPGFGFVLYKVTPSSVTAETDFCPPGEVAADGRCLANRDSVFRDWFEISDEPVDPVVLPPISSALPPMGSPPRTNPWLTHRGPPAFEPSTEEPIPPLTESSERSPDETMESSTWGREPSREALNRWKGFSLAASFPVRWSSQPASIMIST